MYLIPVLSIKWNRKPGRYNNSWYIWYLNIGADGSYTYTVDQDVKNDIAMACPTDVFTYTVSDGNGVQIRQQLNYKSKNKEVVGTMIQALRMEYLQQK